MRVYVNDRPIELVRGMTVRHALIGAGLLDLIAKGKRVFDEWGNEVGLDGAAAEGMRIYLR
jgi:hypothetical protein